MRYYTVYQFTESTGNVHVKRHKNYEGGKKDFTDRKFNKNLGDLYFYYVGNEQVELIGIRKHK